MYCVWEATIGVESETRSIRVSDGPLVLANVCKAWREIAINLPPLYSRIRLRHHPRDRDVVARYLRQTWLPRVGGHPMEVDMSSAGDDPREDPVLSALAQYSVQWRSLDMLMERQISGPDAIDEIRGRIPLLRKLKFAVDRHLGPPSTPIMAFSDAPELREVDLSDCSLRWISLPWTQLTSIQFSLSSIDNHSMWMSILRHTSRLETLCISPSQPFFGHIPALVQLDCLHTLKFKADPDFLDSFTVPTLKCLALGRLSRSDLPALRRFLTRSRCSLHSISMDRTPQDVVASVLASVTTLSEVRLTDID
ncbi:hypothetical protein B0H17DRAFT_192492 [Mycena rosella]|uniref:F-box domain-containing protein n=1 Tax=Mycena rosella TaxID=1033263 RepID=A0AAD7G6B6_MYCRO|nr:hypothetical protein B0H17DRAFT_192492 [Mycena rosella]